MLKKLADEILTLPQLDVFARGLETRIAGPQLLYGVDGSAKSMVMAAIRLKTGRPLLIVTPDQARAEKMYEDMVSVFGEGEVFHFPGQDLLYYNNLLSRSSEVSQQRLVAMRQLLAGRNAVIVTTAVALLGKMAPPDKFYSFSVTIQTGQEWEIDNLLAKLLAAGFERSEIVEQPGQVSVRGGIVDIFPVGEAMPYRIEFFGDTVESVRRFDLQTQRSRSSVEKLCVVPAREVVVGNSQRQFAALELEHEMERLGNHSAARSGSAVVLRMREKIAQCLEAIKEDLYFPVMDQYLLYFYQQPASLLDYLPPASLVFVDDPLRCTQVAGQLSAELRESQSTLYAQGELLARQTELIFNFPELLEAAAGRAIFFSLFSHASLTSRPYRQSISLSAKPVPHFHGQWEIFGDEMRHWRSEGYRVVILTSSRERSTGIADILAERQIPAYYTLSEPDLSPRSVVMLHGALEGGFIVPEIKLAVLTDHDILPQRKKRRRLKDKEGIRIGDYQELKTGDFVVHEQHGIGQYLGIRTLDVGGIHRDYLFIQYAGNDKLFIPIEQIDVVRKYIGVEGKRPKLYALGGGEWSRVKARVQASIRELAKELLELYASRETVTGFAFPPDHPWQQDFEAAFLYEETPDQLQAAREVKRDMEKLRPMDRLVCGDVGYGKTEVALRAAFKAVMAGKQAAFLVPTTVLAQQHYRNFKDRFESQPVTVDVLSRFQSRAEQKATLAGLRDGRIDILVGTHRLLSKDIRFHDLGLLVIDEEQRFGVRHKEKIKMLKKNVDVMTLTATPIPRTLHMSLVGVRDMSVIETPPENRYPVQTYVLEYSDTVIRDAVIREVNRGGQVYFVHNRVQSIDKWASTLQELLPEVRIGVAHGQMPEERLEQVMVDFLQGEYDLLLSTTIVEAGLDIPNVNTIIIHDADRFGLSQLYQLRGRVGRSNRVAYCYLTYQQDKVLNEVAEKRLQAIKEFTELGSGFKIALRDLEIRGAGNILGPEQHGFMMSVGFDLYVKLLEEAVSMYKGERPGEKALPRVEINVDAYLPSSYISDARQKIVFYQKTASLQEIDEVSEVREELCDRFGPLPAAAANLLCVAELKILAGRLGVSAISEEKNELMVRFAPEQALDSSRLLAFARKYQGRLTAGREKQFLLAFRHTALDGSEKLRMLLELFNELKSLAK
ncbi:MAG: transcription-repair coupling factor [Dethiobacter sp.]|nr:transcription-repair coupling factor [Dethiobacter sp.]